MEIEQLITMWHMAVNNRDRQTIAEIVADDVTVGGPKGTTAGLDPVIDWVNRSGITLIDVNWHPVLPNVMVVEESATWPESEAATPVFTVYRSNGEVLTSIHRYGNLHAALESV